MLSGFREVDRRLLMETVYGLFVHAQITQQASQTRQSGLENRRPMMS